MVDRRLGSLQMLARTVVQLARDSPPPRLLFFKEELDYALASWSTG